MEVEGLNEAEVAAAQRLMAGGVLFSESQRALLDWFAKTHDIIFAQASTGRWVSKKRKDANTQRTFATFHEMLIAIIEDITAVESASPLRNPSFNWVEKG